MAAADSTEHDLKVKTLKRADGEISVDSAVNALPTGRNLVRLASGNSNDLNKSMISAEHCTKIIVR